MVAARTLMVASTAAVVCLVWGSISYLNYINKQQITYWEASTSYGECKQVQLPDGTQLTLNSCSRVRYPDHFIGKERRWNWKVRGIFECFIMKNNLLL